VKRGEDSGKRGRWRGCILAAGGLLLACMLLVIGPTGYAVYRYRAAQVYSGNVVVSGQAVTLPTQRADVYTLTLQPQVSAAGGITLGYTLRDSFGRVLASSTDYYATGCPSGSSPNEICPAQSRDFQFNDSLGGPVQLMVQSTQGNAPVAVQVRDESAGGIFASGSLLLFGAFFGCGLLLWVVIAALIVLFVRRFEERLGSQGKKRTKIQEDIPEQKQRDVPNT
jgi:hypothetical protein